MQIAVTGADGFLGTATCNAVRAAGYEVKSLTRIDGDLSKPSEIIKILNLVRGTDGLIHIAAKADFLEEETYKFVKPNILASAYLAEVCAERKIPMVYASAAIISPAHVITSKTLDAPSSGYIESKYIAEKNILTICPHAASLRFGGIYGLNGPNHLGLNRVIHSARSGIVPIVYGLGAARRNYIHVEDAALSLVSAFTDGWQGIHLVAGIEILSIKNIITSVARVLLDQEPQFLKGENGVDLVIEPTELLKKTSSLEMVLSGYMRK